MKTVEKRLEGHEGGRVQVIHALVRMVGLFAGRQNPLKFLKEKKG